jgi:pyruvate/2-oxoglutarate/acetoin dehydrogenase E1 component
MTYREALNLALREEMRRDGRVFVMGGGIGLDDGADETTLRLLNEFEPRRVVHSPIAESGFIGVAVGAAMVGLRPVVELMTFSFGLPGLDRIISAAAKLCYMSGGQYNVPIVIRGRDGDAYPCAEQRPPSLERYLRYMPGFKIVCPSTPADAKGLLKSAIRDDNPVIFIESQMLHRITGEVPDDPDFTIPLGEAVVRRQGRDVTVVAYIGMVHRALEAAEELEKDSISVEIVDPRTLRPLDEQTIVGSVRKTHRAVVGESGAGFAGLDSEIASFIAEQAFDDLDAPLERVTGASAPMPFARNLERLTPTPETIVAAVRRACSATSTP